MIVLKKMQFGIFIPLIIKSALYKIMCNTIKIRLKILASLYLPIKKNRMHQCKEKISGLTVMIPLMYINTSQLNNSFSIGTDNLL